MCIRWGPNLPSKRGGQLACDQYSQQYSVGSSSDAACVVTQYHHNPPLERAFFVAVKQEVSDLHSMCRWAMQVTCPPGLLTTYLYTPVYKK